MRKVKLLQFFKKFKGTSHQIAAINMLEQMMDDALLDKTNDWVVCFEEDDNNYNLNSKS